MSLQLTDSKCANQPNAKDSSNFNYICYQLDKLSIFVKVLNQLKPSCKPRFGRITKVIFKCILSRTTSEKIPLGEEIALASMGGTWFGPQLKLNLKTLLSLFPFIQIPLKYSLTPISNIELQSP